MAGEIQIYLFYRGLTIITGLATLFLMIYLAQATNIYVGLCVLQIGGMLILAFRMIANSYA